MPEIIFKIAADDKALGHLVEFDNQNNDPEPELCEAAVDWLWDNKVNYIADYDDKRRIVVIMPDIVIANLFYMKFEKKPFAKELG